MSPHLSDSGARGILLAVQSNRSAHRRRGFPFTTTVCVCACVCVCSLFVLVLPGPVAKTLSSNPVYLTIVLVLKHSLTWERLKEQSMGVT